MKRIFNFLCLLGLLLSVSSPADTGLGCLRSFNVQPATGKVEGNHDVVIPAKRGDKTGFYFFSGDNSGAGTLFIPLSKQEIEDKAFAVTFKHPTTGREVHIEGSEFDTDEPLFLTTSSIAKDKSKRVVAAADVQVTVDREAATALDSLITQVVSGKGQLTMSSPLSLALRLPPPRSPVAEPILSLLLGRDLFSDAPKIGLHDPAVAKLFTDKGADASDDIARAYIEAVPKMLEWQNKLIGMLEKHLQENCKLAGGASKTKVEETLKELAKTKELNKKIKDKLVTTLTESLPKALKEAKEKRGGRTFKSANNLRDYVAGHIAEMVKQARDREEGKDRWDPRNFNLGPNKNAGSPPASSGKDSVDDEPTHD